MSPLDLALDFDRPYGASATQVDTRSRQAGRTLEAQLRSEQLLPRKGPRSRTFRNIAGRFDGKRSATVRMTPVADGDWLIEVRPKGRRKAATGLLSQVAAGILFDAAKKAVAEKRKAKKHGKRS